MVKVNFLKRINTLECISSHSNNTHYRIKSKFFKRINTLECISSHTNNTLSVTKVIFQVHQYTWVYFNSYKYNCNTLHGVFKVNFLSALIHLSEFPDIQIKHFIEYSKWIFVSALIHLSAFPLIQIIHLTKLKVNFFKRINTLECIPGHTNNTPYNIKSEFLSALIHLSAFSVIQMIHFLKCWKWIF